MGDRPARVRRRGDPGSRRRSEAGDLRVSRRRRLLVSRSCQVGDDAGPRCASTGAATRRCSTPTTPSSPTRSSATRASSTGRSARRRRTRSHGSVGRRSTPRFASGSSTATSRASTSPGPGSRTRPSAREHVAVDVAADIVRTALLGGADRAARRRRLGARPRPRAARAHRRPRPHAQDGGAGPRRAREGRRACGHQRRRQRLRNRGGARVASPPRGDRAADVRSAGAVGGADLVLRLVGGARSPRPTMRRGSRSTARSIAGRAFCGPAGSRR